eukprot:5698236-Pyramimonas_sp.AAC.1
MLFSCCTRWKYVTRDKKGPPRTLPTLGVNSLAKLARAWNYKRPLVVTAPAPLVVTAGAGVTTFLLIRACRRCVRHFAARKGYRGYGLLRPHPSTQKRISAAL